jgi:hypothetical protein
MTSQHVSGSESLLYGTRYEANPKAVDLLLSSASRRFPILSSLETIASLTLGIRQAISEPEFGLSKYRTAAADDPFWQGRAIQAGLECHAVAGDFWGCGACLYVAAKLLNHRLTEVGATEANSLVSSARTSGIYKDNFNRFLDNPGETLRSARSGLALFCEVFLESELRGAADDFAFSSRALEASLIEESDPRKIHTTLAFDLLRQDYSAVLGVFDDFQSCLDSAGLPLRKK